MKILWLCSWYPHRGNAYEGDFIQRHARALGVFSPVTVFYVNQDGIAHDIDESEVIESHADGVKEKIIFFRFKRSGIRILDILVYNFYYYKTYKKRIRQYFAAEGRPDIIHIHVPMKAGMIGRWIKKRWGIPYIISEHSSHYNGNTDDDFLKRSKLYRSQTRRVFRDAAVVTNVSVAIGNRLKKLFDLTEIKIIRNTVDTRIFHYSGQRTTRFRFIHVSTLAPYQKNLHGILSAFNTLVKRRQDFELMIVGPASVDLKQKIAETGLNDFVRFTGEIPYSEVAKEMQQASAFVLFSRFENFPCVIIEALCCGLPVISSGTGGTIEAINETNGIIVESENEEQLAFALNKMMNDYTTYDSEKIAADAAGKYSYAVIGKQFYQLYEEMMSRKQK